MDGNTNATVALGNRDLVAYKPVSVDAIARERAAGYPSLEPYARQVALEFVFSCASIRELAQSLGLTKAEVNTVLFNPLTRAFISDLQEELMQHRIVNEAWVERQVLEQWPKLTGEEEVPVVTPKGDRIMAKKYHAAEVAGIIKHFGGGEERGKVGKGVTVNLNFGDLGITQAPTVVINEG